VLAVLPGSRLGEIQRLAPDFIAAVARLREQLPGLEVIAPMANASSARAFAAADPSGSIRTLQGRAHEAMFAADVVLLASGTAALEAMLAKRPMVVAYRIAPLTFWLVRRLGLMKVDRFSLPNVLAGEALVPELMQHDCTPGNIAAAVLRWFQDPAATAALVPRFHDQHRALAGGGADAAASEVAAVLEHA
jgi:lipid-A-disaccharide synthase